MEMTLDQALQKGIEAHKAGQLQKADRLYAAILQAQPKHPDANHNMGVLAVSVGKVEEALPSFKTALEANPNKVQFWLSYINTLIKLDRTADAQAVLNQAKGHGAKGDIFDGLEARLREVASKAAGDSQNQNPAKEVISQLTDLYNQGQLSAVIDLAQELTSQFPDSFMLWNFLGAAAAQTGRLDEALEALEKVTQLNPTFAGGHNNFGNLLKNQKKLDEAIGAYEKALALKPDFTEAYNNMGNALREQGKLDKAIEAYDKALAIKPDYAEAYNNMGVTLKEHGKLEEAIEAYNKALTIKPDYAEAYNNMGNALKEQGKLEDAIEAYNKARTIKPDYADAYYNMGNILKDQGNLEEAIEAYSKALAIKPDNAEAHNNMGLTLQDQGKRTVAIEAYNSALTIKPDFVEARTNLAILLFENRLYEKAAELFVLDSSSKSQSFLLKCFYELGEKTKFVKQLDHLIERGDNDAVIGSYLSRSKASFGIKKDNPFCNKPLNYVSLIDLNKKCDFKKIFVENAANVLSNDDVKHKTQGHLTNGILTSGNIFTQVGPVTDKWQNIIHAELKEYKENFCGSDEGLIRDWPSDYSIVGWLVSMKSGGELSAHIHGIGWITGSIYINVPPKSKKDSGNLVVTTDDIKHKKSKTKNIKSIDVVTGSLCFFPSSLLHYTIPFEAEENRTVLAFDIIPK